MTALPTLLCFPSHELPLVHLAAYRQVGATIDPPGKEGLGRFMARLMRRTGGGRTADAIDERIDEVGGSIGIDGSHSVLSFHGTVISRNLETFGDLFADVVGAPGLSSDEFDRLKRETRAEIIEARDNDRSLARRFLRAELFRGHPYSRSAAGRIASIADLAEEDVRTHYRSTITPSALTITVAGDVTREAADRLVRKIADRLGPGEAPSDDVGEPTVPAGRRLVFVDKPERTQTQVLIGGLGTHPHDDDHLPLLVANTIFGGTFTARLSREVRSVRGWSYGAYSSLPYDRHRRSFSLWTFPKATDAAPCIALELELLEKFVGEGTSKKEFEDAKRYLTRSHAFSIDTAQKRATLAADEALLNLPENYHANYVDRVRAVTLDEVNAAVKRRLSTEDLLVVVVGTASDVFDTVRDAIPRLGSAETVPFDRDV